MYNPQSDPLKGITDQAEIDEILFKYVSMWRNDEDYTDFNKILDAGDLEYAAHYLVNAGAICSEGCYKSCVNIERRLEALAKAFEAFPEEKKKQRMDDAFKGCIIAECLRCNHHHFFDSNVDLIDKQDMIDTGCCGCLANGKGVFKFSTWE
jgi:hypothetical protein